jgi:hypothetical protein
LFGGKIEIKMGVIKFLMKVFYANENITKYGIPGYNYYTALLMTAVYIVLTIFMIRSIWQIFFPDFFNRYLIWIHDVPLTLLCFLMLAITIILLRIGIKEEEIKDVSYSREFVNKWVNYLILYGFLNGIVIVAMGSKYIRNLHN